MGGTLKLNAVVFDVVENVTQPITDTTTYLDVWKILALESVGLEGADGDSGQVRNFFFRKQSHAVHIGPLLQIRA